MAEKRLSTVSRILFLQLLVIAFVAAFFAMTQGRLFVLYAFLGGLTAFVPNAYFAFRVKRSQGQDARRIVRSFYVGESGKLLLTTVLFMVIFHQFPNVKFLPLMTGYVSALSIFWFALILRE